MSWDTGATGTFLDGACLLRLILTHAQAEAATGTPVQTLTVAVPATLGAAAAMMAAVEEEEEEEVRVTPRRAACEYRSCLPSMMHCTNIGPPTCSLTHLTVTSSY
jgi:hypothetical protein